MANGKKTSKPSGKPEQAFRDFKDIEEDYRFDASIFTQDADKVAAVKYIIDNKVVIVKNGVKYSTNGQKLN